MSAESRMLLSILNTVEVFFIEAGTPLSAEQLEQIDMARERLHAPIVASRPAVTATGLTTDPGPVAVNAVDWPLQTLEHGAQYVRELMSRRGWSHQMMADECGVTRKTIVNFLNGHRVPQAANLRRIEVALDLREGTLVRLRPAWRVRANEQVESDVRAATFRAIQGGRS